MKKEILQILEEITETGKDVPGDCPQTGVCGGCTFGHVSYETELEIKKAALWGLLGEYAPGGEIELVPAASPYRYRNKVEYSFGDSGLNSPLNLGLRKPGARYEVLNACGCVIAPEDFSLIAEKTLEFFRKSGAAFYNKTRKQGELRHLVIRQGFFTGEIMVNLVTAPGFSGNLGEFAGELISLKTRGEIVSVLHTENESVADVVKADSMSVVFGRDYFYEELLGLRFKITPFSFFQTNSQGAESLYTTALSYAQGVTGGVFDLYCGTGTITQLLSKAVPNVTGVEIVPEAAKAAAENAALNNITNCRFIAGDVAKEIKAISDTPELIILDPPREGVTPKALDGIIGFNPEKIIYIACKPKSLKRDLAVLTEKGYEVEKIKAHDMFPRTFHVETVCLLSRKGI